MAADEREAGSATLAAVGVLLALILVAGIGIATGKVHTLKVKTQAVADLAALSGAQVSPSGLVSGATEAACAISAEVAVANGLELVSCVGVVPDLLIQVEGTTVLPFVGDIRLLGRARAGPG